MRVGERTLRERMLGRARRCGSGRGAGWSARAREREKREERVGPASWAVGLVTGPRWFGVWAPFALLFSFLC